MQKVTVFPVSGAEEPGQEGLLGRGRKAETWTKTRGHLGEVLGEEIQAEGLPVWQREHSRCSVGELCPQSPPSAVDENKSTKTWSAWGGKVADLPREKGQESFPPWAFNWVQFAQEYR